jgi:transposase-like protein
MDTPQTLLEASRYFSDLDRCEAYMAEIRWPEGKPYCPSCGADRIGAVKTRRLLRCKDCRRQFSHKVGTIFEDSPLGLDKWFVAVWSIANCKNGISSHELSRALGVTQKTAWFMLHRIRKAMETDDFTKFNGPAEADTTYVGGLAANMHKARRERVIRGRGAIGKKAVHGVLQRSTEDSPSRVRATVLEGEDNQERAHVGRSVALGAQVFTDDARAYDALGSTFAHQAVDHSREFVRGHVHTNGIENFWSVFKRALKGTYIHVAPFHLFRYTTEQVFRFNARKGNDADRFREALAGVFGRRLTYRLLAAIDDAGFMSLT